MNKIIILMLISGLYITNSLASEYFVNPKSSAALWVQENSTDTRAIPIQTYIASTPTAIWLSSIKEKTELTTELNEYIEEAKKQKAEPIFVMYGLPNRDCSGQASFDNRANIENYQIWVDQLTEIIGDNQLTIILEPDALADMSCLTESQRDDRHTLMRYATRLFKEKNPNVRLYIDAGHSEWRPAKEMAEQLIASGIKDAYGFSLNVSNYKTTESNITYGDNINQYLTVLANLSSNIMIDTSRNGNGPLALSTEWCNPMGRKI